MTDAVVGSTLRGVVVVVVTITAELVVVVDELDAGVVVVVVVVVGAGGVVVVVVVAATVRETDAEEACVVVVVAAAVGTMHEHYAAGVRAVNNANLSWMTHCCRCYCCFLGSYHYRCCYPGHSGWGRSLQLSACYGDGEQGIDAFSKDGMGVSVDKKIRFYKRTREENKRVEIVKRV